METTAQGITSRDVRIGRAEILFYLTLFVTVLQASFIVWDFFTLLPFGARVTGLEERPNTVHASAAFSTLYLALLGTYAGYKEFLRWTRADSSPVPQEQARKFKRGEAIVGFWVVLAAFALSLEQLHLISRMPYELVRTTMQALGIMFGTYASSTFYGRKTAARQKQREEDADLVGSLREKIIVHIKQHGFINNEMCQSLCGIDRNRAYRVLKELEFEGLLRSDGSGRGIKYTILH